jgi:hypothetical protein
MCVFQSRIVARIVSESILIDQNNVTIPVILPKKKTITPVNERKLNLLHFVSSIGSQKKKALERTAHDQWEDPSLEIYSLYLSNSYRWQNIV